MMKANILLLGLTIVLTVPSFGSVFDLDEKSCTPVDLRPEMGPNRDQGNMGWCYANTTADLISFRYKEELQGHRVSSGYIALAFNNIFLQRPNSEGGNVWLAAYAAQKNGFCLQDTEDEILTSGPQVKLKEKLSALIYLKQNYDRTQGLSLAGDLKKYYGSYNSVLLTMPRQDLLNLFKYSTDRTIALKFADYMCRGMKVNPQDVQAPFGDSKWLYLGGTRPLISQIHGQLNMQNIIGINYYADFFDADNAPKTLEGQHASSVVGRRWNKKKRTCELLIRNSWGDRCTGYKAASLKEPGVCDKGNIWVSESYLGKYLTSVVWLQKGS